MRLFLNFIVISSFFLAGAANAGDRYVSPSDIYPNLKLDGVHFEKNIGALTSTKSVPFDMESRYKKVVEKGLINKSSDSSCFKSSKSVNYVNIQRENLPLYRVYVLEKAGVVSYVQRAKDFNGRALLSAIEATRAAVSIHSRFCVIGDRFVYSEIYNQ